MLLLFSSAYMINASSPKEEKNDNKTDDSSFLKNGGEEDVDSDEDSFSVFTTKMI